MSAVWVPPRRTYHLRVFGISLALIVLCLAAFLFGVHMEAKIPATGVVTARDLREVRTPVAGLIEPGWYEGEITRADGSQLPVRFDDAGNGSTDPAGGPRQAVYQQELVEEGRRFSVQGRRFHRLEVGDALWPGQVLAMLRTDELRARLNEIEDQLKELESRGDQNAALLRERDRLRDRLAQMVLRVPERAEAWMVLEVSASPLQAVRAGDAVAVIVPIDPQTRQPCGLIARLDVDEKHWGELCRAPGCEQAVRIYSNVYNHRLHGHAEGRVERLEPWGEAVTSGERRFHALAPITQAPYSLPLGSSFKAEVVVGRKLVYRIILEH
jgi:hypothetical protein